MCTIIFLRPRILKIIFRVRKPRFDKPVERRAIIEMCYPRSLLSDQRDEIELEVTKEKLKTVVWDCGRQILDGPFILNEVLHWCNKKKKKSLIFKVDFEKAYDSVRWDFLDDVLKKFGFRNKCDGNINTLMHVLKCFYHASGLRINMSKSKIMGVHVENASAFVHGAVSTKIEDPGLFTLPCRLGDSRPFDTLADLGSCVNIISLYLFKKLNIELLEETGHIFGLAVETKSFPIRIVKDVEVRIGKLKLLNNFYVIDMKKDPENPLLVGRGFLATANAVIDYRKAKIAIGDGITRSVFGVKGVNLGEEEAPY
nr:hypothetical protein [Tanacetum cinerariifolium]